MELHFAKWHGTGNDFVLVDDRNGAFPAADRALIRQLCDRHFGIGSDGLILLQMPKSAGTDFHMEFYNPDASKSFCGNGSRCAFAFWSALHGRMESARFTAIDGEHVGQWRDALVAISLRDVDAVTRVVGADDVDFVHNGSPHELVWVQDPSAVAIMEQGPKRRYAAEHAPGGTNVNFVYAVHGQVHMRTYERGVEAETLSCGTGVVAAALSAMARGVAKSPVAVSTPGGALLVEASVVEGGGYTTVVLVGPVQEVFKGTVTI